MCRPHACMACSMQCPAGRPVRAHAPQALAVRAAHHWRRAVVCSIGDDELHRGPITRSIRRAFDQLGGARHRLQCGTQGICGGATTVDPLRAALVSIWGGLMPCRSHPAATNPSCCRQWYCYRRKCAYARPASRRVLACPCAPMPRVTSPLTMPLCTAYDSHSASTTNLLSGVLGRLAISILAVDRDDLAVFGGWGDGRWR